MTTLNELPGLTFYINSWQEQDQVHGQNGTLIVELYTEVANWDLAEKVRQKFDGGLKIYTVDDFKSVMINVLQQDAKESEGSLIELRTEVVALRRRCRILEEKLAMSTPLWSKSPR